MRSSTYWIMVYSVIADGYLVLVKIACQHFPAFKTVITLWPPEESCAGRIATSCNYYYVDWHLISYDYASPYNSRKDISGVLKALDKLYGSAHYPEVLAKAPPILGDHFLKRTRDH